MTPYCPLENFVFHFASILGGASAAREVNDLTTGFNEGEMNSAPTERKFKAGIRGQESGVKGPEVEG
jgi:hypothetical protein